jgi:hypothetical protein
MEGTVVGKLYKILAVFIVNVIFSVVCGGPLTLDARASNSFRGQLSHQDSLGASETRDQNTLEKIAFDLGGHPISNPPTPTIPTIPIVPIAPPLPPSGTPSPKATESTSELCRGLTQEQRNQFRVCRANGQ